MTLTRNKGSAFMPERFRVRCRGKLHILEVTPDGQLARLDHDPMEQRDPDYRERQAAVRALGGPSFRCDDVVEAWARCCREFSPEAYRRLPRELQRALRGLQELRRQRNRVRESDEHVARYRHREAPWFLTGVLTRLLHGILGVPADVTAEVVRTPPGYDFVVRLRQGGRLLLDDRLQRDWFARYYARGLAVLDGGLTLHDAGIRYGRDANVPDAVVQCRPVVAASGVGFALERVGVRPLPGGYFYVAYGRVPEPHPRPAFRDWLGLGV
jgi:hypothetical protein